MNRITLQSHVTSGTLHVVFLVLAFLAPVSQVLDQPRRPFTADRVASVAVAVVPEVDSPRLSPEMFDAGAGQGDLPEAGQGSHVGPRPRLRIEGTEKTEPELAIAPPSLADDVAGMLAGFADETIGEDTETALGDLDDGGGGAKRPSFRGFGLAGSGASCFGSWKYVKNEAGKLTRKVTTHGGCKAAKSAGISTAGLVAGRATAMLKKEGECDGQECVPTVDIGEPHSCTATSCPWKEIIERVIKRHRRELSYCYEGALRRRAEHHAAELTATFVIAPEGGTAELSISGTSGIDSLDECVASRAERWIFPQTGYSIRANYPFRFRTL